MLCFSSEYQKSLATMFKIPDFDEDVPKTGLNYNKSSTVPNEKVTLNKVGNKDKLRPTVKKKKIEKTANNSIVKAKDKSKNAIKYEVQKNVHVKNNNCVQETEVNKFKKSKQKQNMIESVNSVPRNSPKTKEPTTNIKNNTKKKKVKNVPQSGADWLDSYLVTDSSKNKNETRQHKLVDFDEELLKAGKKRLDESIKQDEQEAQLLFTSTKPLTKKEKLRNMLMGQSTHRSSIKVNSSLRERMLDQLRAAQFRYLNEQLYTREGREAQALFADPAAFRAYHAGYRQQLRKWPLNPLHVVAQRIKSFPKSFVVADVGCGEGALATLVPQAVRGFDLVAGAPGVTPCDMAAVPLPRAAVHVAVYCLALMGPALTDYLLEANRILKEGGHLLIAEVESRFDSAEQFARGVARLGFRLARLDRSHRLFYFFEFVKTRDPPAKRAKLPRLTLKPCLYKKR